MPQVASALKNYASQHSQAARPPRATDRAPTTAFASLIDDNASAPQRSPQVAADDQGSRVRNSDRVSKPAKSADGKDVKARNDAGSADAGRNAKKGVQNDTKADKSDPAVDDGKALAEAKIAKLSEGNDALPTNNSKPDDDLAVTDAAIVPPTDPGGTTDKVTVTAFLFTADNGTTAATPATENATAAAPQAGTAKTGNDTTLMAKEAAQPQGEAKPQDAAGAAAHKDPRAHAGVEPAQGEPVQGEPAQGELAQGELAQGETSQGERANAAHHPAPAQAHTAPADAMTAAPKAGVDVAPPIAHSTPLHTSAPAAPASVAGTPMQQAAAIPFAGVAVEIAGKALAGKNHFEIRLDPPELGRIEVRLHVDRDGNVTSRMIADRPDTLDLLRRDASGLDRALQDAGLKTSDNSLQFSLRDQSAQQQQSDRAGDSAQLVLEDDLPPAIDAAPRSYSRLAGLGKGVDIQV